MKSHKAKIAPYQEELEIYDTIAPKGSMQTITASPDHIVMVPGKPE
jgi:hypothetical protein